MSLPSVFFWGFVATLALTTVMSVSQGLRLTRMSIPYMLGTMLTARRERAKLGGFFFHLVNGWVFSLLYAAGFALVGQATWWLGALAGTFHALAVLSAGMWVLPAMHPRMASEEQGPTVVRQLEPPGFLALHYGARTPLIVLGAHVLFGVILGVGLGG